MPNTQPSKLARFLGHSVLPPKSKRTSRGSQSNARTTSSQGSKGKASSQANHPPAPERSEARSTYVLPTRHLASPEPGTQDVDETEEESDCEDAQAADSDNEASDDDEDDVQNVNELKYESDCEVIQATASDKAASDRDDEDDAATEYDGPSAAAKQHTWLQNSDKHFEQSATAVQTLIRVQEDYRNAKANIPSTSTIALSTLTEAHASRSKVLTETIAIIRDKGKFCRLMSTYANKPPEDRWSEIPRIPDARQCDALGTLSMAREDHLIAEHLRIPSEFVTSATSLLNIRSAVAPDEHLRVISSQFETIRALINRTPGSERPPALIAELKSKKTRFDLFQAAFPLIYANKEDFSANYGTKYRRAQRPIETSQAGTFPPGGTRQPYGSEHFNPRTHTYGHSSGSTQYAPGPPPPQASYAGTGFTPGNPTYGTVPPQSSYTGSSSQYSRAGSPGPEQSQCHRPYGQPQYPPSGGSQSQQAHGPFSPRKRTGSVPRTHRLSHAAS